MESPDRKDESSQELSGALDSVSLSIANDLHDLVVPLVFAAKAAIDKNIRSGDTTSESESASRWLAEALSKIRDLINSKELTSVDDGDLIAEIQAALSDLSADQLQLIQWNCDSRQFAGLLEPRVSRELSRIAVEAIRNAAKHASPTFIRVSLQITEQGTELLVEDDGIGFEPHTVRRGHHGLKSMRSRAINIGASLKLKTIEGQGTTVSVLVPTFGD